MQHIACHIFVDLIQADMTYTTAHHDIDSSDLAS